MVTELVILLTAFFVVASLFTQRLKGTFEESAPRLGANIEKRIHTGTGFQQATDKMDWNAPDKRPEQ